MSFRFEWPEFGPDFHAHAARMLNSALNKGPRPKVIADDIKVKELNMGSIPPELDILEIGDLTTDRFRGIFRLTYNGDAHLILSTKVQANPLSRPPARPELSIFRSNTTSVAASASRGILFAASPLIVPMHLRLSQVRLRAIVVLVISKSKGVTLVFKNDPLESVDVSSTFDGVAVIQKYLQQEIEGQLREMFREDLPGIIHRLSQSWLARTRDAAATNASASSSNRTGASNAPSAKGADLPLKPSSIAKPTKASSSTKPVHIEPTPSRSRKRSQGAAAAAPAMGVLSSSPSTLPPMSPTRGVNGTRRPRTSSPSSRPRTVAKDVHTRSQTGTRKLPKTPSSSSTSGRKVGSLRSASHHPSPAPMLPGVDDQHGSQTLRDIEEYDPTYGLRPDEVDLDRALFKSGFSGLGRLLQAGHHGLGGLGGLADDEDGGQGSEEEEAGRGLPAAIDNSRVNYHHDESRSYFEHHPGQNGLPNGRHDEHHHYEHSPVDSLDESTSDDDSEASSEELEDSAALDEPSEEEEEEEEDVDPFVSSAFGSEAGSNTFGGFTLNLGVTNGTRKTIFDKMNGSGGPSRRSRKVSSTSRRSRKDTGVGKETGWPAPDHRSAQDRSIRSTRPEREHDTSHSKMTSTRHPAKSLNDPGRGVGGSYPSSSSGYPNEQSYRGHVPNGWTPPPKDGASTLSERLSSPSRLSVARSLSGVGISMSGAGHSSGLGLAAGLTSIGAAAAVAAANASASAGASTTSTPPRSRPESIAASYSRPRIYHVTSRAQVPVLDEDEPRPASQPGSALGPRSTGGRSLGGGTLRAGGGGGGSAACGPSRYGYASRPGSDARSGAARTGTAGTRTIRAPASMASSQRGWDSERWPRMNGADSTYDEDHQRTLRATTSHRAPLPFLPNGDGGGNHAYRNGEETDKHAYYAYEDQDDDERQQHQAGEHAEDDVASLFSRSDVPSLSRTGSSADTGLGSDSLSGSGSGHGAMSSEASLQSLAPTPLDPRSTEYKRQVYREQYRRQGSEQTDLLDLDSET